jgi:hypothetical protein
MRPARRFSRASRSSVRVHGMLSVDPSLYSIVIWKPSGEVSMQPMQGAS